MLSFLSVVLGLVYIYVVLTKWSSRSVTVLIVRISLAVALLVIQILLGNLWLSLIWGVVFVLCAISLMIAEPMANKSESQPKILDEEKKEGDFRCSHCGTFLGTDSGNCKQCGAPLSTR